MSSVLSVSDNCERGMAGTLQFGNGERTGAGDCCVFKIFWVAQASGL